jgi:DNA-binding NtrC family response regulator
MRSLIKVETFPTAVELVGASPGAERARAALKAAANGGDPVLISAEAGLDPLAIARAIHEAGRRASGRFITIDCAQHDAATLSARLFGSSRPPHRDGLEVIGQDSLLHEGFGGTLLLANMEGLPSQLQGRLARLLRDRQVDVEPGSRGIPLDARVIATTTGNVEDDMRDGKIRRELGARFSVRLDLPPLRHRPADIPMIIGCLAAESASAAGVPIPAFGREALMLLSALPWRRNLEELREVVDVVVLAAEGATVGLDDVLGLVPIERTSLRQGGASSLREARMSFEREYITAVLHRHRWRMDEASKTLGVQRTNLYRKVRQLGIGRQGKRNED